MMKYILDEEYEFDFSLMGICCHEKNYRLCWALNKILNTSLERAKEDIEIILNKSSKPNLCFPLYYSNEEGTQTNYYLIGNKCGKNYLIPEKQYVDFFLMIKSSDKVLSDNLLKRIRSVNFILTAQPIIVEKLKSKKNLIF